MLHTPPWSEVPDEHLEREVAHAHEKRHDIFVEGTAAAWANLLQRTAELEAEYLRRFPNRIAEAAQKSALYPASREETVE